jgi:hypothetical protein
MAFFMPHVGFSTYGYHFVVQSPTMKTLHKKAGKAKMTKKAPKTSLPKNSHRRIGGDHPEPDKSKTGKSGFVKPGEKRKGQSALATAVAEDELEERRRLFAKARKGDKGAVAKIYELYGARIYTTAQVKEVKPARYSQVLPLRRRAQRG